MSNQITPEQEQIINATIDTWKCVGLSTARIDKAVAVQKILNLYDAANIRRPHFVVTADSPIQALYVRASLIALETLDFPGQCGGEPTHTGDTPETNDALAISNRLRDELFSDARVKIIDQEKPGNIKIPVNPKAASQNGKFVLSDENWAIIVAHVKKNIKKSDIHQTPWVVGSWDSFWLSYYDAAQKLGVEYPDNIKRHFEAYTEYSQSGGVAFCYEDVAFVCDRPNKIEFDELNRLHAEVGPAVSWPDGLALYSWHGVNVPEHWIEGRATLDPNEVIQTTNVEQRAAGCAIVGWPKMVTVLNRKVIDGDPETDMGALIELTMPGLNEPGRFLQAKCPRNGTIVEGVPRVSDIDNLPIDTVLAAQAWRVGDPQSEYAHPPKRT